MVAIGLLDIPPEIQLQIAEFVETGQALKALSVTSRALCSIAQSILFKTLEICLEPMLRGSIGDLLANPRICAAIRFLELDGQRPLTFGVRKDDEQLSLIQKMLPKMVGLRKVSIHQLNLNKAFLDTFLEIAANKPLRISLERNIYPYDAIPTRHTPLQLSHLHLTVDHSSLEFYRSMFHASATTLTGLSLVVYEGEVIKLVDIDLPFLHDLTLLVIVPYEISMTSVAAFITAQNATRKLDLKGRMRDLPPIPPNALPNLRELKAPPELVNQLVPGRPVEAIEVIFPLSTCQEDWFWEGVTQSTALVRMLRVHLNTAISNTRMAKRMVTMLPFLENLWLPVFDDVSWRFRSITKTLAAHFPSDTPRCRRSPHFTQVPQVPTLRSVSSRSMGRPQHQ